MINTTISHYHILERLGGGGMGVVYKARDLRLNSIVALKFLPTEFSLNEKAKKRFIQEAQAAASLDHQNICVIHDIDESDDQQIFICMNYYEGETLKKRLERGIPSFKEAIGIAIQIARGLNRAHEAGIVHRDIKPANIMLTKRGEVKIVDFGLAKLAGQSRLTKTHGLVGTLSYMSPEQARGEAVDARSDIWSLGVLLYELMTGKNPFQADYEAATLYSILNEEIPSPSALNPEIKQELEIIIIRALQKNPVDRFQSMEDMLTSLIKSAGSAADSRAKTTDIKKKSIARFLTRKPMQFIAVGLVTAIVIAMCFLIWFRAESQPVSVFIQNFENKTDKSAEASVISDLLADKLDQSRSIRILSKIRIAGLCTQLSIDTVTAESAFDLARAANVQLLIQGDMITVGSVLRLNVRAYDVASKDRLFSWEQTGPDASALLHMINDIAADIRSDLPHLPFTDYSDEKDVAEKFSPSMEANALFMQGKEYYYEDQRKAIAYFEQAVAIDSSFMLAYLQLAIACDFLDNTEKALIYAKKAKQLAAKNNSREYLKTLAVEAWVERNWDKSIDYYLRYIELQPGDLQTLQRLGYILMRNKKDYNRALEIFNQVLQLDPDNLSGRRGPNYNYIGIAYQYSGNMDEALAAFKKYQEMSPDNADALHSLGAAYQFFGQYAQAIDYHHAAIEADPNFFYTYKDLGLLYLKLGRWRDALDQFRRYMTALPKHQVNDAHVQIAEVNLIQNNFAAAHYEVEQMAAQNKKSIKQCWLAGQIDLQEKMDIRHAQQLIRDMEDTLQADPAAHDDIAYMYHLKGRLALAVRDTAVGLDYLRLAVETSQWEEYDFRKELTNGLLESGRYQDVINEGQHLIRINENDAEVLVLLGQAWRQLGKAEQAKTYFNKALMVWQNADNDFLPFNNLNTLLSEPENFN